MLLFTYFTYLAKITKSNLPINKESKFIVSIASYPKRDQFLPAVFQVLSKQKVLPKFWVLVLSKEEYPKGLPRHLDKLKKQGLKIILVADNPYAVKKLIPTLEMYPDLDIVTLDDDFLYYCNILERLKKGSDIFANAIIGLVGKVLYRKGECLNMFYRDKKSATIASNPLAVYFLGGSGTYYPAKSLHPKVYNLKKIKEIVPGRGSDMWFWAAAHAKGTQQYCIGELGNYDVGIPIPLNTHTKTREQPPHKDLNLRFQKTIDYFEIREKLLKTLPNKTDINCI